MTIEYVYYYDSNQVESFLPSQDKFDPSFHVVTESVTADRYGRGLVQKACVEVLVKLLIYSITPRGKGVFFYLKKYVELITLYTGVVYLAAFSLAITCLV